MSRNNKTNVILTREKRVKVGTKVIKGTEPMVLVGSEKKKDTISIQDIAVALYGPGTRCVVIPPGSAAVQ